MEAVTRDLPPDHPIFHRPDWALVDALTNDEVYGKPPAQQPEAILEHLANLGWRLVRQDD
jgi:hypothetical protein